VSTSLTLAREAGSARTPWRAWGILLVLCGAIFLEGIDVSMMGVALPAIQSDLSMTTSSLQWVVSAYMLGYGGFMLLGGPPISSADGASSCSGSPCSSPFPDWAGSRPKAGC
jgi:MFS family permease